MTRHRVRITDEAEQDLFDIYRFIATSDSTQSAAQVLDELESLCLRLTDLPLRGHVPPELDRIGVTLFREVHFKPYRIIYEVSGQDVYVHAVVDGRRDMQSLLERRLTR